MKSKLKQLALILAAAMLFCTALTACGGGGGGGGGGTVTPKPTPTPGGTEPDYTVDKENKTITALDGSWVIEVTEDETGNEVVTKTNDVSMENQSYAVVSDTVTKAETDGTITVVRKLAIPRSALEELEIPASALVMLALDDAEIVEVIFTFTYTSEGELVSVTVEYEDYVLEYNDVLELVYGNAGELSALWNVILDKAATEDAVKDFIRIQSAEAYRSGQDILTLAEELKKESAVVDSGFCGAEGNEENVRWTLDKDGVLVISGNGKMADFYIAPWDADAVTSVVVKQGVTNVGAGAFKSSLNLRSATIAAGVTEIGFAAFESCENLRYVKLPQGVTSIVDSAFSECISLKEILLPTSIESIGPGAFWGCSSLKEIVLPAGITSIEYGTFANCESLAKVSIPEGVTNIRLLAFSGCTGLTSITIPASVTNIEAERGAFSGCANLDTIIVEEANASYADENGILLDKSRTKLILYPAGKADTDYEIPRTVVEIGAYAFSGCENLKNIVIPGNVNRIAEGVFFNCQNLARVEIEEGVTNIGQNAFSFCTGLRTVKLPSSLAEVEQEVFNGCTSLTEIVIPEGVQFIRVMSFDGCSSLRRVYLPKSLILISTDAFEETALSEIFYAGSEEEWAAVFGSETFTDVVIHYNATF